MNRTTSTFAIALLSSVGFAGCALAGDEEADMQAKAGTEKMAASDVRDWGAIDTNNDNLIQPAEMEVALKPVGPQAKPAK